MILYNLIAGPNLIFKISTKSLCDNIRNDSPSMLCSLNKLQWSLQLGTEDTKFMTSSSVQSRGSASGFTYSMRCLECFSQDCFSVGDVANPLGMTSFLISGDSVLMCFFSFGFGSLLSEELSSVYSTFGGGSGRGYFGGLPKRGLLKGKYELIKL